MNYIGAQIVDPARSNMSKLREVYNSLVPLKLDVELYMFFMLGFWDKPWNKDVPLIL